MSDVWQGYASPTQSGNAFSDVASPVQSAQKPSMMDQAGRQLGLTGRYGVEGVMALPNMIGNAANSAINLGSMGINKLAGTNIPMLGMPSQSTSDLLTKAGMPQPNTAGERVVGDMSRALVSAGAGIAGANAASDAIPMMQQFANNAAMQAKGALGAAGAAGTTREMGGGSIMQTAMGLLGGYGATRQPFANTEDLQSLSQGLKSDARQAFSDANSNNAVFNQSASSQLPNDIDQALSNTGKMNAKLHGDTMSVLDDFKNDANNGPLTLEDLHQQRQLLGQVVNKNLHPNGAMMPDAMKADQAIDTIDKFIENAKTNPQQYIQNASPDAIASFQNGLDLWSKSARANDIERIMDRADMMQQPATALRTGFRTLVMSKRFSSFPEDQQNLIRAGADTSLPMEVLNGLGSRLIGAIASGTGNVAGGMAANAVGSIPRNLATQAQMNRAQAILDSIAKPNIQYTPNPAPALGTLQGVMQNYQGAQ